MCLPVQNCLLHFYIFYGVGVLFFVFIKIEIDIKGVFLYIKVNFSQKKYKEDSCLYKKKFNTEKLKPKVKTNIKNLLFKLKKRTNKKPIKNSQIGFISKNILLSKNNLKKILSEFFNTEY